MPHIAALMYTRAMSAIMLMGTCSNAGKSLLATGLCRALVRRGLRVRPFKPQNMSNNAAVTIEGGEIGRAQALQARACGVPPASVMNPVLLKPQGESKAQLVVRGEIVGAMSAREYHRRAREFLPTVLKSYRELANESDIVVVEGAGSPAEANLRTNDIANMGFAKAAGVNSVLIGDIERGGVIASIVGTMQLLDADDRQHMRGFIVNRFRGDAGLFTEGMDIIERHSGLMPLGLVPFFSQASNLPAEDSLDINTDTRKREGSIRIAVPRLARMANFDDFDPLLAETDVSLLFVPPGEVFPGNLDAVILPGSKATRADLAFMREQGWDVDILAHRRRGGHILGICAGYQMLGKRVIDNEGIEGDAGESAGLGLLESETLLRPTKTLQEVRGKDSTGVSLRGYEMHIGETVANTARPMLMLENPSRQHGEISADGRIEGCYLHGIFSDDGFRHAWLNRLRKRVPGGLAYEQQVEETLDALSKHIEQHINIERLLKIAAESKNT
ncbi:MAG: cobyric acid synthase [Hyphomicrobiales bacterium]|nr:cobyric acid synthase [Hyphomicrobiales bacterium]